jgi:hypothetical protein
MGSTGIFRAELDLPPGDYGYKFVVDGDQYIVDPENITLKYVGGVENSRRDRPRLQPPAAYLGA